MKCQPKHGQTSLIPYQFYKPMLASNLAVSLGRLTQMQKKSVPKKIVDQQKSNLFKVCIDRLRKKSKWAKIYMIDTKVAL